MKFTCCSTALPLSDCAGSIATLLFTYFHPSFTQVALHVPIVLLGGICPSMQGENMHWYNTLWCAHMSLSLLLRSALVIWLTGPERSANEDTVCSAISRFGNYCSHNYQHPSQTQKGYMWDMCGHSQFNARIHVPSGSVFCQKGLHSKQVEPQPTKQSIKESCDSCDWLSVLTLPHVSFIWLIITGTGLSREQAINQLRGYAHTLVLHPLCPGTSANPKGSVHHLLGIWFWDLMRPLVSLPWIQTSFKKKYAVTYLAPWIHFLSISARGKWERGQAYHSRDHLLYNPHWW